MPARDPHAAEAIPSILVVDDDEDLRRLVVHALRGPEPRHVEEAPGAAAAKAALGQRRFDLVITDLSMPGEDGLRLMQWANEHAPGPSWIVLTGYGSFESAVEALQLGAFDFLSKPLEDLTELRSAVRNALDRQRLLAERDRLWGALEQRNRELQEHVAQLEEACLLLRDQADTIRADLHRAALIQRALLPRCAPEIPGFRIQALYRPSLNVGGDVYDVVPLDAERVALLVADAAGHGLAAAMLAVLFRNQLALWDPATREALRPCDVLQAANRAFTDGFGAPGLFLTAAYGLLDVAKGELSLASAGHPPLLLQRRSGPIERIYHTGPALGLNPEAVFTQQEVRLERGDRLLLYTDGLYHDASDDERPASDPIAASLECETRRGSAVLQGLLAASQESRAEPAAPLEDDVTLLLLEAAPGESVLDNGMPDRLAVAAALPPARGAQILAGGDAQRATLSIQGRASWVQSAAFHEACREALDEGKDVVLDLTLCPHLDSTLLGTIHELVVAAEQSQRELRLQGVLPPVEALFHELGMQRVLEHVVPAMLPLPTRMGPLVDASPDQSSQALRMLRAHEGLASLSDRNRREFDPLLALLRRELASAARPGGT